MLIVYYWVPGPIFHADNTGDSAGDWAGGGLFSFEMVRAWNSYLPRHSSAAIGNFRPVASSPRRHAAPTRSAQAARQKLCNQRERPSSHLV
jgi:hypothetical protein